MAVDQFIKIGDIKGEAKGKDHEMEIDVLTWRWGIRNLYGTGQRMEPRLEIQNIYFTKYIDAATAKLFEATTQSRQIEKVVLSARKAGGVVPLDYFFIEFSNVTIVSISTGIPLKDNNGEITMLTEEVELGFEKYLLTYQEQDADGGKCGGQIKSRWNIMTNTCS